MDFQQGLHTLRAGWSALTGDSLLLMSLLAFIAGAAAHLVFRDRDQQFSTVAMLLLWGGVLGVVLNTPEAQSVVSRLGGVPLPVERGTIEEVVSIEENTPLPDGESSPANTDATSSPNIAAAGASGEASAAERSVQELSRLWMPAGELTDEIRTRDHRCIFVKDCTDASAKTNYRLQLHAGRLERLSAPVLRCISGACAASSVEFTRLSPDQRRVEASFDVWGAPTAWRLSARLEAQGAAH